MESTDGNFFFILKEIQYYFSSYNNQMNKIFYVVHA